MCVSITAVGDQRKHEAPVIFNCHVKAEMDNSVPVRPIVPCVCDHGVINDYAMVPYRCPRCGGRA